MILLIFEEFCMGSVAAISERQPLGVLVRDSSV